MYLNPGVVRPFIAAVAAAMMLSILAPMAPRVEPGPVKVRAAEVTEAVDGQRDFSVSRDSTHVAVHWRGSPDAVVRVSFSTDGRTFTKPTPVELDDESGAPADGETYGTLMGVEGVTVVRVSTDRPLDKVTVLALNASGAQPLPLGVGAVADAGTDIPPIISRSQWGADETLRFDPAGDEFWPREYYPVQKLIVHHTAGRNNDPDPAATVRAIYYYHAVTRRWFDIGYNYLIDEAGRVYEGRYARDFWNGEMPSSDNVDGLTVAGGHTKYFNQGTMAIALLGDFTSHTPTAAAQASLVKMLAWAAAKYNIDPHGASTYVNPFSGVTKTTNNIGGHRDYSNTGCPGGVLYALLPTIRDRVAAAMNTWPGETYNPPRRLYFAAGTYIGHKFSPSGAITASKPFTLAHGSSALTSQVASVPTQSGSWYYVTTGVWAGYWVAAATGTWVGPAPPRPSVTVFATARPIVVPAATIVGRRFSSYGTVTASKSYTLSRGSMTWTTQKSTIPGQSGNWYYITYGLWRGYWIQEIPGMWLGPPAPPLPVPIAVYDPPRRLQLAPGTYVGKRFSQFGVPAGSYSYTLTKTSSAPTSRYSTLPGQTGNWYYIVDGIWDTFWIKESAATTLLPP
jgi:N-acetylmuramoyl-L-alanine amidase